MFRRSLVWIGLLGFCSLASIYSSEHTVEGLAFTSAILVASIIAVRARPVGRVLRIGWIPAAWVAILFVSDHRFELSDRSPLDAVYGNLSVENIVQVTVYAIVFGMVVRSRHILVQETAPKIRKLPILLFPIFALASALWSAIPVFTVVRALQLLVIVSLALLTVRIWQSSAELGQSIWKDTLSLFVQVVTVVSLVGFIVRDWPDGRFTWPGISGGSAATYIAAALLILTVGGRAFSPNPPWTYWFRLCLLGAATYLGQTRSVLAALVVAGLAALWALGRERPLARYLGIGYYALGLMLLVLLTREQLVHYLSRGDGPRVFTTLNSRVPLWGIAINDVSEAGKWIGGFGYGAARVVLYPQVFWAGSAHNTWIEALMGVGIIGVLLLASNILFLLWRLGWSSDPNRLARLALVLLVFLLVVSMASEAMVLPGIGFGLFALIQVPALIMGGIPKGSVVPGASYPVLTRAPRRALVTSSGRTRRRS
jgi:hypothetical protein